MSNDSPKGKDLAKIHIAKKDLGLDDDTYRAMIRRIGGVESSAQLDAAGRRALLAEFRAGGWKPKAPRARRTRPLDDAPQSRKIRALWLALFDAGVVRDPGERALAHYVRRQTGVEDLRWLDSRQANVVIESLKAWAKRAQVALED